MEVAARRARADDHGAVEALSRQFHAEQRLARGGVLWDVREAPAHGDGVPLATLSDPEQLCVVGTIDEVVVAFAIVVTENVRDGRRIGRVESLYVDAEARTVGVGEELMVMVLDWCRSQSCVGIDAYALPGERLTKNFFESNGFVARLLTMHHRFDDET